jgi:hypothetical protein
MIKSAAEFCELRCSEKPNEYHRAAWEEAPMQVWLDVIAQYPDMRSWVAHNKTVPLEILAILADDPDRDVRYTVATKRKLDQALQTKLSKDSDAGVRQALATNAKASGETLQRLADDADERVRAFAREKLVRKRG